MNKSGPTKTEYHKIVTVWDRDPATNHKTLISGAWSTEEFAYLKDLEWVFTEKVNGTNIRLIWDCERAHIGGRSDSAQIPANLLECLNTLTPNLGKIFNAPAVIYGEGYGVKIQKGGGNYNPDRACFVVFDVRVGDTWLERENVDGIAKKLGIDEGTYIVPIVDVGPLTRAIKLAEQGFDSVWGNFKAEGLVMRPSVELLDRRGHRIIAKIKSKDFPRVA